MKPKLFLAEPAQTRLLRNQREVKERQRYDPVVRTVDVMRGFHASRYERLNIPLAMW